MEAAGACLENFKRLPVSKPRVPSKTNADPQRHCKNLVVLNAGSGGLIELMRLIAHTPDACNAGIISLQKIVPAVLPAIQDELDHGSALQVRLLEHNSHLYSRYCYIGVPGRYLAVKANNGDPLMELEMPLLEPDAESYFDLFLDSAVQAFGDRVQVILLSGAEIGSLAGLKHVKQAGGEIIAQKPSTCMIPDSVIRVVEADLIDIELRPNTIPEYIGQPKASRQN